MFFYSVYLFTALFIVYFQIIVATCNRQIHSTVYVTTCSLAISSKHIKVFFLAVMIYLPIITVILESIFYLKMFSTSCELVFCINVAHSSCHPNMQQSSGGK